MLVNRVRQVPSGLIDHRSTTRPSGPLSEKTIFPFWPAKVASAAPGRAATAAMARTTASGRICMRPPLSRLLIIGSVPAFGWGKAAALCGNSAALDAVRRRDLQVDDLALQVVYRPVAVRQLLLDLVRH